MPRVRFEQAVYGSFPFWDKGYALLAASPGCRAEWLADFETICQRFGEPSGGASTAPSLLALRLPCGVHAFVGVAPQGTDDRGRPGALAFHGLFLTPREFRKAGYDPFRLADAIQTEWGPETTTLPAGSIEVEPEREHEAGPTHAEPGLIAEALRNGRRVAIESATPIDALAREVWRRLPLRARRKRNVATLAFRLSYPFDLLATPRLAGFEHDPSYRTIEMLAAEAARPPSKFPGRRLAIAAVALTGIGLALAAVFLTSRGRRDGAFGSNRPARTGQPGTATPVAEPGRAPAPPQSNFTRPIDLDQRERITEGLVDLAGRFGIDAHGGEDPAEIMVRLADRLRYRDRWLSPAELRQLRGDPSPEAATALRWHDHLRHFAPDRPLPPDFARGPLDWQLATLAWSFHVEPHPYLTPPEIPFTLADALAVEAPIRPNTLAERYPALTDYARFLARLPRR